MKIIYETTISYWHRILNQPNLADDACRVDHYHEKAKVIIKIPTDPLQFLDYKDVQKYVTSVLEKYSGKNVTNEFNLHTAEEIITALQKDLEAVVKRPVDVELWETPKYGMELASNQ